jgi:hypothetical protein
MNEDYELAIKVREGTKDVAGRHGRNGRRSSKKEQTGGKAGGNGGEDAAGTRERGEGAARRARRGGSAAAVGALSRISERISLVLGPAVCKFKSKSQSHVRRRVSESLKYRGTHSGQSTSCTRSSGSVRRVRARGRRRRT